MKDSKILWTKHTFNPWKGCTKVSEGCLNCYAEEWAKRFNQVEWNAPPIRTSKAKWSDPKKWDKQNVGKPRLPIFCASLADVFDVNVPTEWRGELWDLIRETPNLAWLLLTKRPQNIEGMIPTDLISADHVWLGCTIENQKRLEERLPIMQKLEAQTFLSLEPLLEPINSTFTGIDWIIVGGESGKEARPFDLVWCDAIKKECRDRGIPFFFKQVGDNAKQNGKPFDGTPKDTPLEELPDKYRIRESPNFGVNSLQMSLL